MDKKAIAIDGPAGAGKSTVARLVAERLKYLYIDTGAMYRALTYKAMSMKISLDDRDALTCLAVETEIELLNQGKKVITLCDGLDVTEEIRTPEVSQNVSFVALVPGVRKRMVELQRFMARSGGVVMDGRDICTQVLPKAECKFFLTASLEERARRRHQELSGRGFVSDLETVKQDIKRRDSIDEKREVAPLICADDAEVIDSTKMTIQEVVEAIIEVCERKR